MRVLRPFFWAAVLAAGFIYLTAVAHWDVGRVLQPVRNAGRMWSEPATAADRQASRPTSRTISTSTRRRATPR